MAIEAGRRQMSRQGQLSTDRLGAKPCDMQTPLCIPPLFEVFAAKQYLSADAVLSLLSDSWLLPVQCIPPATWLALGRLEEEAYISECALTYHNLWFKDTMLGRMSTWGVAAASGER